MHGDQSPLSNYLWLKSFQVLLSAFEGRDFQYSRSSRKKKVSLSLSKRATLAPYTVAASHTRGNILSTFTLSKPLSIFIYFNQARSRFPKPSTKGASSSPSVRAVSAPDLSPSSPASSLTLLDSVSSWYLLFISKAGKVLESRAFNHAASRASLPPLKMDFQILL